MTDPDERPFPRGRDAVRAPEGRAPEGRAPGGRAPEMRAPEVDRTPSTGAGAFYLIAGVLIAIVLAAGLMFFDPGLLNLDQARQSIKVQQ